MNSFHRNLTDILLSPGDTIYRITKDKVYDWKSSNDKIISFTRIAGGKISVKAKRIGDAVITYYAQDGSIFAESDISVNARTTFLGGIRFNPGESKNTVKNRVQWQLNEEESTENLLVYNVTGSEKIKQEIYYFESDKLFSLLVILVNSIKSFTFFSCNKS